jgi:hypothetical protein
METSRIWIPKCSALFLSLTKNLTFIPIYIHVYYNLIFLFLAGFFSVFNIFASLSDACYPPTLDEIRINVTTKKLCKIEVSLWKYDFLFDMIDLWIL